LNLTRFVLIEFALDFAANLKLWFLSKLKSAKFPGLKQNFGVTKFTLGKQYFTIFWQNENKTDIQRKEGSKE